MPKRKMHILDEVALSLKDEVAEMADALSGTFIDTVPLGQTPQPTKRQKLTRFLGMDQQDKVALANSMGPEAYNQFVSEQMATLYSEFGPAAQKLMPYFYGGLGDTSEEPLDRDTLEAELLNIIEGASDAA
jgi:hypothetical protein